MLAYRSSIALHGSSTSKALTQPHTRPERSHSVVVRVYMHMDMGDPYMIRGCQACLSIQVATAWQ